LSAHCPCPKPPLRAAQASLREARAMDSGVASLVYDIDDWEALDWYNKSIEVGKFLHQKGFCFIRGGLSQKHVFMPEKKPGTERVWES